MIKIKDGVLCCPVCGFDYIYHKRVIVFERDGEDSETGICTDIIGPNVKIVNGMDGNPSRRRDGIKIHFTCEECFRESILSIYQHKGNTFVDFR